MFRLALLLALSVQPALAAPRLVADIAPVASLVGAISGGPVELALPPAADPHHASLRPSDMRSITSADLVVWTGPALSPALARVLESMDAPGLTLSEVPGTHHLEDHDHGHDHGEEDPHLWLDPDNLAAWIPAIVGRLIELDPGNAAQYEANAAAALAELERVELEVSALLASAPAPRFAVAHDAFGHFSEHFGTPAIGALSDTHGGLSSPAHLSDLGAKLREARVACIVTEPSTPERALQPLDLPDVPRTPLDVLARDLPRENAHLAVLRRIAETLATCH